jgi:hypothetical protein
MPERAGEVLVGDDLRRHLRDAHHFDVGHLRIAPAEGLAVEHEHHHQDGIDMEPHTHG